MKPSKLKDFFFLLVILDLIQICWEPLHYYNEVTETQRYSLYCILGSREHVWLILYREAFVPHSIHAHCMTIFRTEAIYLWWLLLFLCTVVLCVCILRVTAISNCDALLSLSFSRGLPAERSMKPIFSILTSYLNLHKYTDLICISCTHLKKEIDIKSGPIAQSDSSLIVL